MGYSLWKIKKKKCFLFFYSTEAVLLSFFFSGLWSMVGSGRMPPGLSVMYEFVSFSVLWCFFCGRWPQSFKSVSQKLKTQKSERGEKHTNKDCLFVYSKKNEPSEWNFFSGNVSSFSSNGFVLPRKGQTIFYSCISLHLGLYFDPVYLPLTSKTWDGERWALPVKAWNYSDEITLPQSSAVSPSAMWQLIWTADNTETE